MSVLGNQSAVNLGSNFWVSYSDLKNLPQLGVSSFSANNISSGSLTANFIKTNNLSTGTLFVDILNGDEATISSISTNALELDGAYLTTVGGNEVLLNGIPIATTANLSSIQDWAIFPAVSSITVANSGIDLGTLATPIREGYFSTIYANNAQIVSTILVPQEIVSSLFVNVEIVSTVFAQIINAQQGNFSSISSGIVVADRIYDSQYGFQVPAGIGAFTPINMQMAFGSNQTATGILQVSPFMSSGNFFAGLSRLVWSNSNFSTSQLHLDLNNGSTLNRTMTITSSNVGIQTTTPAFTLDVSGSMRATSISSLSSINGQPLSNYNALNWSEFPALQNVNMAQRNLNNTGTVNANTVRFSTGTLTGSMTFGGSFNPNPPFNFIPFGTLGSDGTITTIGNINGSEFNGTDASFDNLEVGNPTTSLADVNIYGATALPGDNALYVEGGVEFDGGLIHGTAFGCLPVAGINTTRFSMTPIAGIVMITPVAISMNAGAVMNQAVGGAYSLAVGGVASLAAGTYMEINSGSLKMINDTPIIFSANAGTGDPGGLNVNTYTTSDSLALDGLPFGAMDKYKAPATFVVSSGTGAVFLESVSLPRIGQWLIKTDFEVLKPGGGANSTDAALYYAPTANPTPSAFSQCVFAAPMYSMPSTQYLTISAPITVSTITGFTSTIQSTITENFSTFLSTGQTFSTFTSSFFSTVSAEGGLNLWWDASQSQNSFTATLNRGSFYASYLGGFIPPA